MSEHHHSHRHGDTKGQKTARRILAFFLFLCVSLLSLTVCVRACFVSEKAVVTAMTSDTYVSGVTENVKTYAHDLCDECAIPYDSVDAVLTFDAVYRVQKAYYNGILGASAEFSETAYQEYIAELGDTLKNETNAMLSRYRIETAGKKADNVNAFCEKITAYLTEVTALPATDRIASVLTVGKTASLVALIAVFLLALVLGLIIISIGKKTYRALRDIAFSFYAGALLNLLLVGGAEAVKHIKSLVLYPHYLSEAVLIYVNRCIFSVGISAAVLLVLALALTVLVWTMNRNENN